MPRRWRLSGWLALALALALVAVPATARAEVYEQLEKPAADVVVGIRLDRTTVSLSGELLLTYVVIGAAPIEVEPVAEAITSKEWEARAVGKPAVDTRPDKRVRWRQTFRLEPFPLDKDKKLPLAVNPLRYRTGDMKAGDWREQAWKPVEIEVTSTVVAPNLDDAKEITGIERLAPVPAWPLWEIGAGIGLVAMIGGTLAWRLRRRRPEAAPELPPHEWALSELERIDSLDLPGTREVERYHTLVSNVLRRYIELRFRLHAAEQTTPEFLAGLRRSSTLPEPQQELLRDFLQRCDLAKFARTEFSAPECRATAGAARDFIHQTVPPPAAPARNGQAK